MSPIRASQITKLSIKGDNTKNTLVTSKAHLLQVLAANPSHGREFALAALAT